MKKKIIALSIIFFIFSFGLSSNNKRIHLSAYVPETVNIKRTTDDQLKVTFNSDNAYYKLSNLDGITTNYHNASYFNIFII